MRLFSFGRRGQVKGIDFSIAIIIYLLVLTQILILTNNVIQLNYQTTRFYQEEAQANNFFDQIAYYPGTLGWGENQTNELPIDWRFGLESENHRGTIDPVKLGRLADNTNTDFRLTYNDVATSLSEITSGRSFKISTSYTMNVSSSVSNPVGNTLEIEGYVLKHFNPLNHSSVNIYAINQDGVLLQPITDIFTNSNGYFETSLTFSTAISFAIVVVIASHGLINQATDIQIFGTPGNIITMDLQETHPEDAPITLETTTNSASNLNFFYLFAPLASQDNLGYVSGSAITSISMEIPSSGLLVAVAISNTELGYTAFPVALDGTISDEFRPPQTLSAASQVVNKNVMVRGIILILQITLWSDVF
jgi:hypothetical protein